MIFRNIIRRSCYQILSIKSPITFYLWRNLNTNKKNFLKKIKLKKNFLSFQQPPSGVDIEKGDLNGNETSNTNIIRKKTAEEEASYEKKSVLCHAAFVTVGITFIFAVVAVGWYYMGFVFGLPSLLIALIALLFASGGWHWLFIAIVTLPRDIKWVILFLFTSYS